ncbi:hypothetical protein AB6A40_010700 [Gnathostoma spinigerum]|uniref:Uncharacterized protein n=1 Tax=Gnathostoma spinigerum TaxID=75299 RepID=A0ABD6EVR7_9BILA
MSEYRSAERSHRNGPTRNGNHKCDDKCNRQAPIAQAECSDTDYETSRSINRASSMEKAKSSTESSDGRQPRERAQSADSRHSNGTLCEMMRSSLKSRSHKHGGSKISIDGGVSGFLTVLRRSSTSHRHIATISAVH